MKKVFFLFLCSVIVLSSCNEKSTISNNEIKQIIVEKYEKMRTTLKSGDASYVLNMHSKDAILYLPNGKEVVGIAALKPFYEKVASTDIDIKSIPTTIELLSEVVIYEVGTFTSTSKTGIQNSSKYINIWKKVDGDWKLFKAIDQAKL
jgi:ketosteroid isomerase-like protein